MLSFLESLIIPIFKIFSIKKKEIYKTQGFGVELLVSQTRLDKNMTDDSPLQFGLFRFPWGGIVVSK